MYKIVPCYFIMLSLANYVLSPPRVVRVINNVKNNLYSLCIFAITNRYSLVHVYTGKCTFFGHSKYGIYCKLMLPLAVRNTEF
jgi:hypothetical protein